LTAPIAVSDAIARTCHGTWRIAIGVDVGLDPDEREPWLRREGTVDFDAGISRLTRVLPAERPRFDDVLLAYGADLLFPHPGAAAHWASLWDGEPDDEPFTADCFGLLYTASDGELRPGERMVLDADGAVTDNRVIRLVFGVGLRRGGRTGHAAFVRSDDLGHVVEYALARRRARRWRDQLVHWMELSEPGIEFEPPSVEHVARGGLVAQLRDEVERIRRQTAEASGP
jgi:hypothetical protein